MNRVSWSLTAAGCAVIMGVIGCSGHEFNAPPLCPAPCPPTCPPSVQCGWSPKAYAKMADRGKELFDSKKCATCHTVNGVANLPGPDLSDYGSEGWPHQRVADFIANAQCYYPGSKMPSFRDQCTDKEINDLAAYLSTLKKQGYYLAADAPMVPEEDQTAASDAPVEVTDAGSKAGPSTPK